MTLKVIHDRANIGVKWKVRKGPRIKSVLNSGSFSLSPDYKDNCLMMRIVENLSSLLAFLEYNNFTQCSSTDDTNSKVGGYWLIGHQGTCSPSTTVDHYRPYRCSFTTR